jgi:hypothetical protein
LTGSGSHRSSYGGFGDWPARFAEAGFAVESERRFVIALQPPPDSPMAASVTRYAMVTLCRARHGPQDKLSRMTSCGEKHHGQLTIVTHWLLGHYWSWSWISAIDAAVLKRSACLTNSPGASADAWEVRNLRSRRVIRMILISLGLGEASRNGQPFRSA